MSKTLCTSASLVAAAVGLGLGLSLLVGTPAQANPNPLFPQLFTADPATLVDEGRVYLYTGVDEASPTDTDYVMNEWHLWSTCDMVNWVDHGSPVKALSFAWAKGRAWAADITRRDVNGKPKYYFYATVDHATVPGLSIGVAVSDSPTGPFVDARGSALITNDMTKQTDIFWDDIDPAIFIDDNGQAYLYWGNTVLKYVKLKPNMIEIDGDIHVVPIEPFTEASYLHKHKGTYYLSYSQGFPEETIYATGPTATGPWTKRNVIMDVNRNVKTIHQAIADFNGKSYIFYHTADLPGGAEFRRSVAVEEFSYQADGSIPFIPKTKAGPTANPTPACKAGAR
ncbi:glycoside hydrolase family 43 protein [Roseateles koreensis]|uniref:Glycoside hydrolase family 43 protein n=1 Tax=Roseateles koreensis TaxID=2987526 RepID=A0ABT5KU63_9BURK|nr:glycoside hydrolase family 43 protein [Roseateles koreensis]MDC8786482.1 glycoside hydrolase family 43 protein [Roseateles koreensis]